VIARGATAAAVTTADCLPIALAADGAVAMLHAGWRGLLAGIIPEGVRTLRKLVGDGPIAAAVGPGAGPCCYEVDEHVHRLFAGQEATARRGKNLDLKAVAADQLSSAGVASVADIGLCTICEPDLLFFSHRRDHGLTGRQAGLVWLS
jgi:YfiH family protein